jgi:hypothetical protein
MCLIQPQPQQLHPHQAQVILHPHQALRSNLSALHIQEVTVQVHPLVMLSNLLVLHINRVAQAQARLLLALHLLYHLLIQRQPCHQLLELNLYLIVLISNKQEVAQVSVVLQVRLPLAHPPQVKP